MPTDVDNLKKAVYKSLRYCQAKINKSLYISSRKTIELKKFQKNLANIVKKKSNELFKRDNIYAVLFWHQCKQIQRYGNPILIKKVKETRVSTCLILLVIYIFTSFVRNSK